MSKPPITVEGPYTSQPGKTSIGTCVLWFAVGMAFVFTLILAATRG